MGQWLGVGHRHANDWSPEKLLVELARYGLLTRPSSVASSKLSCAGVVCRCDTDAMVHHLLTQLEVTHDDFCCVSRLSCCSAGAPKGLFGG